VAKKSSHQRHLSEKELRSRIPNRRLQAGMESVTKSLFNQRYCFNSFVEIVTYIYIYIYIFFFVSSDALQGNLWLIFVMLDGYVEGDLYRNRDKRVWH
jgi:hypothetical protein